MTQPSNALTIVQPRELVERSSDIAGLCKEIVIASAMEIQGRKYVKVEGWQSIATAHGCVASSGNIKIHEDGVSAIGEVRRMSDGALIASAEGFVGRDEPTWFGGEVQTRNGIKKLPKRPDYAIRAMAQTRAISRACRSAFAHIVVLMDAGLSTTPAEEIPAGGFDNDEITTREKAREESSEAAGTITDWRTVKVHFGKNKDTPLKDLNAKSVKWYADALAEKRDGKGKYPASKDDLRLLAACEMALMELNPKPGMKSAHTKAEPPDEIPVHRQKLAEALEWAGHTIADFMAVAAISQWLSVDAFDDIAEESAEKILEAWDSVILPALDAHKKGVK